MTASDLAAILEGLAPSMTQTNWRTYNGIHVLAIRAEKPPEKLPGERYHKPSKNICVFAANGIRKTDRKQADAQFICLVRNNLELIIKALQAS